MNANEIKSLIRDVKDFPKKGIVFKDITPVLGDARAFRAMITLMAEEISAIGATKLVGIESRGFIFAAALAERLQCGLVLARKKGKLPWKTERESYKLEYGEEEMEIHLDAFEMREKIIVVDDVLATGGTAAAAVRLCKKVNADVVGVLAFIELGFLGGRDILSPVPVHSILKY